MTETKTVTRAETLEAKAAKCREAAEDPELAAIEGGDPIAETDKAQERRRLAKDHARLARLAEEVRADDELRAEVAEEEAKILEKDKAAAAKRAKAAEKSGAKADVVADAPPSQPSPVKGEGAQGKEGSDK